MKGHSKLISWMTDSSLDFTVIEFFIKKKNYFAPPFLFGNLFFFAAPFLFGDPFFFLSLKISSVFRYFPWKKIHFFDRHIFAGIQFLEKKLSLLRLLHLLEKSKFLF